MRPLPAMAYKPMRFAVEYHDLRLLILDGYSSALLSSDSLCSLKAYVGAPFRPLMELGAPPPFEECVIVDVDRSLGFRRDFSRHL